MNIKKITITPQEAVKMLEKNTRNRAIRKRVVEMYAKQMVNGEWQLNGESIKFATNGELKDGQHRLEACVLAGVPFETYVVYDDDSTIFDVGVKRSVGDLLKFINADTKIANGAVTGAVRIHLSVFNGSRSVTSVTNLHAQQSPTTEQMLNYLEANEPLLYKATEITRVGSAHGVARKSACILACYYALKCNVPEEILRKFFEVVNTGYSDSKSQFAAIMIRNNLVNKRLLSNGVGTTQQVCMAIRDFAKGKERSALYNVAKGVPYMDTVIAWEKNADV